MASVYDLKPRFQALLRPTLRPLAGAGLTANHVTLAALGGSIAVGVLVSRAAEQRAWLLALPVWLFLRMALNAIDGMMARELAMKSDLGAVLNELGDVLSDIALYAALAWVHPAAALAVAAFVVAAVVVEFSGVLMQALGGSRRYDGPMGKSDRALWIGALALLTYFRPGTLERWPVVFAALTLLGVLTVIHRLTRGLREARTTR